MIPIFYPHINEDGINAVIDTLKSQWWGLGPKTKKFEELFADYIGVNHAVALNSCTSALDLSLKLLDIKESDEIIVPTITFASTAHAVKYNNAKLIFVDVDYNTLNLDLDDVKEKITSQTRAIIPVHYSGRPIDFDKLKSISKNIYIIEDAAHASGSIYKNKKCGSLGDIAAFSFHAVKPLAVGDGGAITTNSTHVAKRAKCLSWIGIDKTTWDRIENRKSYAWEYEIDEIGYKYHMNDIQASLAIVQLSLLDSGIQARKERALYYHSLLSKIDEIKCPILDDDNYKSSWHIFCIKCKNRNELGEYLIQHGISVGVHYKPLHLYKCYKDNTKLPTSEKLFTEIMTLPLYASLDFKQIDFIVEKIKIFYGKK